MNKPMTKFALGAAALAVSATANAQQPVVIEKANVLPNGMTTLNAGAAYETGRESTFGEYDNIRLGPVGVRHGAGDGLEFGGYLTYNSNDADNGVAPDEGGIEGITGYLKTALNANIAVTVGVTLAGSDDVLPYPNDGIDFFVNLPMERRVGNGTLYGEFGYTAKDAVPGLINYFNYGVGYAFPLQGGTSANVELVGDEGTLVGGNHMDLVFGVNTELSPGTRLAPYASVGLYDASPDIALGVNFETRI